MAIIDDEGVLTQIQNAQASAGLLAQLAAIPLTEYRRIDDGTIGYAVSTSDSTFTTTIPDTTWVYPQPLTVPWIDQPYQPPYQPWETVTIAEYLAEIPIFQIDPEDTEVVKAVIGQKNPLTDERKTKVELMMPEMSVEEARELLPRLEEEFKLAIIRALRLIPSPQRIRTLILEEECSED